VGGAVQEIAIGEAGIRLGQLLKLAGLVESGGSVKTLLAESLVEVNGRPETPRGPAQARRQPALRRTADPAHLTFGRRSHFGSADSRLIEQFGNRPWPGRRLDSDTRSGARAAR